MEEKQENKVYEEGAQCQAKRGLCFVLQCYSLGLDSWWQQGCGVPALGIVFSTSPPQGSHCL